MRPLRPGNSSSHMMEQSLCVLRSAFSSTLHWGNYSLKVTCCLYVEVFGLFTWGTGKMDPNQRQNKSVRQSQDLGQIART